MKTATTDYAALALKAAGNWEKFPDFCWHSQPDEAEQFALVYTDNRDSGALDRANAKAIRAALEPFIESGDCIEESHNHWAVGYVNGYAIRVYKGGAVSDAFIAYCDLQAQLDDYPVLDEELYSAEESEDQESSWENWARSEFSKGIEKRWDADFDVPADKLREIFDEVADKIGEYWTTDDSGSSISVDSIVAAVPADAVREYAAEKSVRIECDGQYLCDGTLQLDEYTAPPLYELEFAACMDADDNGEESVSIDGKVYTWQIV